MFIIISFRQSRDVIFVGWCLHNAFIWLYLVLCLSDKFYIPFFYRIHLFVLGAYISSIYSWICVSSLGPHISLPKETGFPADATRGHRRPLWHIFSCWCGWRGRGWGGGLAFTIRRTKLLPGLSVGMPEHIVSWICFGRVQGAVLIPTLLQGPLLSGNACDLYVGYLASWGVFFKRRGYSISIRTID